MKIIVLGSGTSHGIPVPGCCCRVCSSEDPPDKRMRSSVYIEGAGGQRLLIDAGPEFRLQALRAGIRGLDGVFLSHAHADHIHGLDDLRPLSQNGPVPIYGNERTIAEMTERFSYVFGKTWGAAQRGGGKPKLSALIADGPVRMDGLTLTPVPVKHGVLDILGWEVNEEGGKSFLYLTDTSAIPSSSMNQLKTGSKKTKRIIVIGGLRMRPHETHFSFEQAMETALGLGAQQIYLTHICHEHSHAEIEEICRLFMAKRRAAAGGLEGIIIHPARDGLEITL